MFTGIIETIGTVVTVRARGSYKLLIVKPDNRLENLTLGESISVDGCCLTVTESNEDSFIAEASQETSGLSIVGNYKSGTKANLERALLPTSRLGGHFVTGHVDCRGTIERLKKAGNSFELSIRFPAEFDDYLVAKGSIAINGISLTINQIKGDIFIVNLIPFTRERTTVDLFRKGDEVNLEFDILGKHIARLLRKGSKNSLTLDKLIESGW